MEDFTGASEGASEQLVDFLERFPLLRKQHFEEPLTADFSAPGLRLPCLGCKREQTFVPETIQGHIYSGRMTISGPARVPAVLGDVIELPYRCAGCKVFVRRYFLEVADDGMWIRKLGQSPPWDISPSKDVDSLLGPHAELYRKGLVCESQGYGIGAFAYYRRVVEQLTDELLAKIESLLRGTEQETYHDALVATRAATSAARKFELIKEHLPPILKPGGGDPLGRMYGLLSEGLHSLADDDCLGRASEVRFCLEFVVRQIMGHARAVDTFVASMAKLATKSKEVS